ncbi:MAG: AAA family ATPase [Arcobacteraceae bacterium]|jgi:ABC-type Mn2+/Zn2+ transport system ATPase subunit|nr:AAA family ATPase [Arcobacteraceae bacterium]
MNSFSINLKNIQHINSLNYSIDLSQNALHCIVGKNGVGKTTLIKVIQNFKETNTLDKLSRLNIIKSDSEIVYTVDENNYRFTPILDDNRYILDTKDTSNQEHRDKIYTELPMPRGERFNTYATLGGDIGEDIKTKFAVNQYDAKPRELIAILNTIYNTQEFNTLEQFTVKGKQYYLKPINSENYIREDDFSSGEYMIIQIYKFIQNRGKLIVIDELDISLDSRAQVNLIQELKKLAQTYKINIVFTTHSLAIMKKIDELEENLYFMDNNDGVATIEKRSYNFIKAELFQFAGYDKIILVEDSTLERYLKYLIPNENIYCKYDIIYAGGHKEAVTLMKKNENSNLFNTRKVMVVLDGDQNHILEYQDEKIKFIPFLSIEKHLLQMFNEGKLNNYINVNCYQSNIGNHALYKRLQERQDMSEIKIFEKVNSEKTQEVNEFKTKLMEFLNQ